MSVNAVDKSTGNLIKTAGNPVEDASGIHYSHTTSGLLATNVQDAIDESYMSLKSGLTTLDNEVNGDATTYPYADVITIEDAIPANLADYKVKIEPVQDLHGQSAPYVGGAGKNKLHTTATTTTQDDVTYTVNSDGTISVSGTASGVASLTITTDTEIDITKAYILSGLQESNNIVWNTAVLLDNSQTQLKSYSLVGRNDITFDDFNEYPTAKYLKVIIKRYQNGAVSGIIKPMLRLSTETDATFAPYTNICPISGHTEVEVQRDGKNLFDEVYPNIDSTIKRVFVYVGDGEFTMSTTTPAATGPSANLFFLAGKVDGGESTTDNGVTSSVSRTVTSVDGYVTVSYRNNGNVDPRDYETQIEKGSTVTPYEPYAGKTYTIQLGDTRYGGVHDVNSGEYSDFGGMVNENDFTYDTEQISAGGLHWCNCAVDAVANVGISNMLPKEVSAWDKTYPCIYFYANRIRIYGNFTSLAEFKEQFSGLQVYYQKATPTTIQLTPQQIQLLQGTNTLTASTGQISVTVNGVSGAIGQVQEQVNGFTRAIGWGDARNIFNGVIRQGYVSNTTGEYVDNALRWVCTTKQECKENTTYTFSASSSFLTRRIVIIYFDSNDTMISYSEFNHEASPVNINATITTPDNTAYIIVDIANQANAYGYDITPSDVWDVQIEEGTQVTPYIPYHPIIGTAVEELLAKLPDAPTTDGTYNLQVTVSSGTSTYSWVSTT